MGFHWSRASFGRRNARAPSYFAFAFTDRHRRRLPTAPDVGDRSAELWIIPEGGKARSLGVIASKVPGWKSTPNSLGLLIRPGATLAISLEPSGGSPTGQPTGPVILSGPVEAV